MHLSCAVAHSLSFFVCVPFLSLSASPINQFAGPGLDSWLYEPCVEAWSPFLPADAQKTMAFGGYYQARARPGLRVVSLNSNYMTDDNFWIWCVLTLFFSATRDFECGLILQSRR
jgi:hypothetical protein